MSNEITLVANDIVSIKYCLYVIAILLVILVSISLIKTYISIRNDLKDQKNHFFKVMTKSLIEQGRVDEAIKLANEKLSTHPNHAYANYILARSHFVQKNYNQSYDLFEKTLDLEPTWEKEFVGPFLKRLEDKVKNNELN